MVNFRTSPSGISRALHVSFGPWRRPNVRRGTHQRQDACDSDRLACRRRSELQVRRIAHFLDCRPVPWRQLQLVSVAAIPFARKPIRTISGGFGITLEDSNSNLVNAEMSLLNDWRFLVRSCDCAVACLCPRNSISNVVASVTIHDDIQTTFFFFKNIYL